MGTSFTPDQIEKFNDRIENCLRNPECLKILEIYVKNVLRNTQARKVIDLWKMATGENADFDALQDLIDEIDSFNASPLLSIQANEQNDYITSECCRILTQHHAGFIEYLRDR